MKNIFRRAPCFNSRGFTQRKLRNFAFAVVCIFILASYFPGASGWAATPRAAQDAQAADVGATTTQFDSGGLNIDAYLAKPKGGAKNPAVIVIHDNQGLNDSMREITRQLAAAGFVAMAPDLVSRLGAPKAPGQTMQAISQLSPNLTVQDLKAAFAFLQKDPDVDPAKISVVGFGWGGWRSFMLATSVPDLYRAVVYSGSTPAQGIENAHTPVLANYAQYDFRVTGNALSTEKTMHDAGKNFTYYVYPGVYRAFYSAGPQYNAEAAKLAWTRTLDFLRK
jgi:carboxymethylenebutenolidase